jgi:hypothetical protein
MKISAPSAWEKIKTPTVAVIVITLILPSQRRDDGTSLEKSQQRKEIFALPQGLTALFGLEAVQDPKICLFQTWDRNHSPKKEERHLAGEAVSTSLGARTESLNTLWPTLSITSACVRAKRTRRSRGSGSLPVSHRPKKNWKK